MCLGYVPLNGLREKMIDRVGLVIFIKCDLMNGEQDMPPNMKSIRECLSGKAGQYVSPSNDLSLPFVSLSPVKACLSNALES